MTKKLFVGNLSFNTSEDDLRAMFEQAGDDLLQVLAVPREDEIAQAVGEALLEAAGFGRVEAAVRRPRGTRRTRTSSPA